VMLQQLDCHGCRISAHSISRITSEHRVSFHRFYDLSGRAIGGIFPGQDMRVSRQAEMEADILEEVDMSEEARRAAEMVAFERLFEAASRASQLAPF
jgi:hypothetical protein